MGDFKFNGPSYARAHALAVYNAVEALKAEGHTILATDGEDVDHTSITYKDGSNGKTRTTDVKS